jgi:multidrug resistance efflux pump
MHEGVSVSTARVLEVQRDARIAAAQLSEARAKLDLLRAGSREEDIREARARLDVASAELDASRARLEQCSIRAPVDGVVTDVLTNPGRFLSLAVPEPLLNLVQDGPLRVRAEIDPRDLGRVCVAQTATVSAEPFPNQAIRAQVASLGPAVTMRTLTAPGPDARGGGDVVTAILDLDRASPVLPIGLPVSVRFAACPARG